MRRVLPIVILVTIIEIIGVVWLGIYLFTDRGLSDGGSIGIHYVWPAALYIVFVIFFGLSIPFKFFSLDDMYCDWEDKGKRFNSGVMFLPFTFVGLKAPIYNYIDALDFTPIINQWKQFWGY